MEVMERHSYGIAEKEKICAYAVSLRCSNNEKTRHWSQDQGKTPFLHRQRFITGVLTVSML